MYASHLSVICYDIIHIMRCVDVIHGSYLNHKCSNSWENSRLKYALSFENRTKSYFGGFRHNAVLLLWYSQLKCLHTSEHSPTVREKFACFMHTRVQCSFWHILTSAWNLTHATICCVHTVDMWGPRYFLRPNHELPFSSSWVCCTGRFREHNWQDYWKQHWWLCGTGM